MGVIAGLIGISGSLAAQVGDALGLTNVAGGVGATATRHCSGEIGVSMLCIVLGVLVMRAQSRWPSVWLIAATLLAMIIGDTFVAMCMLFALAGGVLTTIPDRRRAIVTQVLPGGHLGHCEPRH
jgi:hypothetical protein